MRDDEFDTLQDIQEQLATLRERMARIEARELCDTGRAEVQTLHALVGRLGDQVGSMDARLHHTEERIVKHLEKAKCEHARPSSDEPRQRLPSPTHSASKVIPGAGRRFVAPQVLVSKAVLGTGKAEVVTGRAMMRASTAEVLTGGAYRGAMLGAGRGDGSPLAPAGSACLGALLVAALGNPKNRARNAILGAALGAFLGELV